MLKVLGPELFLKKQKRERKLERDWTRKRDRENIVGIAI